MKYFETSAKTGFGIKEVFSEMYKDIYELNKSIEKGNEIYLSLENKNNTSKEKKKD